MAAWCTADTVGAAAIAAKLLKRLTQNTAHTAHVNTRNTHRECCFVATLAADGCLLFWDTRVEKLSKRSAAGGRRGDDSEAAWKPMHAVHLLNAQGAFFPAVCVPVCAGGGAATNPKWRAASWQLRSLWIAFPPAHWRPVHRTAACPSPPCSSMPPRRRSVAPPAPLLVTHATRGSLTRRHRFCRQPPVL